MATRMIATEMWQDSTMRRKIKDITTRYVWLYLLTNSMSKTCGIFQMPLDMVSLETKLPEEKISLCIDELTKAELCYYCVDTEEIVIFNYPKYNVRNLGKPMIDCLSKELSFVKNRLLVDMMVEKLEKSLSIVGEESKRLLYEQLITLYRSFGKKTIIKEKRESNNTNTNTYINTNSVSCHDSYNDSLANDNEMKEIFDSIDKKKGKKK